MLGGYFYLMTVKLRDDIIQLELLGCFANSGVIFPIKVGV